MAFAAFQLAIPAIASAEPLRCAGSLLSPGDAKLELLGSCSHPAASDQFCVWNKAPPTPYVPGYGLIRLANPICVPVEELFYERGPRYLPAIVRVREVRIVSIRFGSSKWDAP
ncbi:DUF2845 domain-containing protein [Pandoraea sputorum]|uniref:DUF2845 domain-containing protein n=1 Tax=Pandoraea sputorum TaxID=93222 RepID=UPI003B987609